MLASDAYEGVVKWKVGHPRVSNNIVQMRSGGFQAPFYFGGSQVPFDLGVKGNTDTSTSLPAKQAIKSRNK
jgi:hypothetical protein